MNIKCKNCDKHYTGNYCNYCGQSSQTHDINARFFLHDIQHGLLHIDKGLFYTIHQMFIRPGHTIKDYMNGKRVRHFKPISFLIVIAGLYGFIIHYFHFDNSIVFKNTANNENIQRLNNIFDWFNTHYTFNILLLLPFSSLCNYWAFYKKGYNYFQHLIINSFFYGFHLVLRLIFILFFVFLDKEKTMKWMTIPDVLGLIFNFWAFTQLFNFLSLKKIVIKVLISYLYLALMFLICVCTILMIIGVFISK